MSTQLVQLSSGTLEKVSAKSGMVTNTLVSRKEFRKVNGLSNAEAKRQYRALQFEFSKHASPVFNGLVADGNHVCTSIKKSKKGRYTFVVASAQAVKQPKSGYVPTPTEFIATLSEEQKAELRMQLGLGA